jgi:hypothetical protein
MEEIIACTRVNALAVKSCAIASKVYKFSNKKSPGLNQEPGQCAL